jgi:sigma-B regulation protein RsbU (phosphoserine phosphatase)
MHVAQSTIQEALQDRRKRLLAATPDGDSGHLGHLLQQVDSALSRLDSGTFGICEECDVPIEPERLATDPLARVCLECLSPDEQKALEQDLELAARIQHRLLPQQRLSHGGWEAYYHYEPLGVVSGDHCDLIPADGPADGLLLLFGDVSGKGVAASILMAHLHATFRSLAGLGLAPDELLRRTNHLFAASTPSSSFATLVCGRLSPDGRVEVANAGHCPPLVRRGARVTSVATTGLPLGLFLDGDYSTQTYRLEPGDLLLFYTDGLTESAQDYGSPYDEQRLASILTRDEIASAEAAATACLDDVASFRNGSPRTDDLTVLAIRRAATSATRPAR